MGYYWAQPDAGPAEPDPTLRGKLFGIWLVPETTVEETKKIIAPMEQTILANTLGWADPVRTGNKSYHAPDFSAAWAAAPPQSVGSDLRLGSRLLDREALETDLQTLRLRLKQSIRNPDDMIIGHLVAGLGVKNVKIPGGANAVLPAWRDAYVHLGMLRPSPGSSLY